MRRCTQTWLRGVSILYTIVIYACDTNTQTLYIPDSNPDAWSQKSGLLSTLRQQQTVLSWKCIASATSTPAAVFAGRQSYKPTSGDAVGDWQQLFWLQFIAIQTIWRHYEYWTLVSDLTAIFDAVFDLTVTWFWCLVLIFTLVNVCQIFLLAFQDTKGVHALKHL